MADASKENLERDEDSARLAGARPDPGPPDSMDDAETEVPPDVLEQAARALGPQGRQVIERVFAVMSGQSQSPIWEKITPQHLTDMLASRREESSREHTQWVYAHFTNTIFIAIVLLAGVALLFFALVVDKQDVIAPVVTGLLAFGSGIAVGRRTSRSG